MIDVSPVPTLTPKPILKRKTTIMDQADWDSNDGQEGEGLVKQKTFRFKVPESRGSLRSIEVSDADVSEDSDYFKKQDSKVL